MSITRLDLVLELLGREECIFIPMFWRETMNYCATSIINFTVYNVMYTIKNPLTHTHAHAHTQDEYKFCYTAVLEFLDSFDHYANFD